MVSDGAGTAGLAVGGLDSRGGTGLAVGGLDSRGGTGLAMGGLDWRGGAGLAVGGPVAGVVGSAARPMLSPFCFPLRSVQGPT